ncbi:hypothetical protein GON01_06030 [Sphingomonas sp. MAH-20]|uniref:UPF0235 protein GON01_06030 n=1 Tax=Sphingomonas horti TaxID=2682842 RepID=A0A6I4J051_9SPHN|nr:DUF167 domain-containing protein [Sphingomonas sp. CGMCC 1.13658]MBA2918531.1 DUF167 domain-containing protein [Sphingomonas sp. CGMCC 1.13658]MVO77498.1 hypothetical protein [Sphingomonas horti]
MPAEPWSENADGLTLTVRVTPKASRTAIAGIVPLPDGRTALSIRLAAPPVEGAANAELAACLSKTLGIPKSAITLASGQTARVKTLRISGAFEALADQLRTTLER